METPVGTGQGKVVAIESFGSGSREGGDFRSPFGGLGCFPKAMETDASEPKGVIGRSYKDGLPVIWAFANEQPSVAKRESLTWLAVISWKYDGSDNNGMPVKDLNERMIRLEDAIEEGVVGAGFCEHAISKTGSHLKELIYYIADCDFFLTRLNDALRSHDRYPIEITFYKDPDWKEHEDARSLFDKRKSEQGAEAPPARRLGLRPLEG